MARNTPATETAALPNRQVNGTISGELFKALDDHRWDARIDRMPKLVALALEEYAVNHGLKVGQAEEVLDETAE